MRNISNNRARNPPQYNAVSSLLESAERGTLPADLIKDLIYSNKQPRSLSEDTQEKCVVLNEGEAAFLLDTPAEMTQLEELITNLTAAQIPFSLSEDEETQEVIMSWSEGYSDAVESAMDALGITVLDDNEIDAGPDYQPFSHTPGTKFQTESLNETAIMKPVGEIPVKKPLKQRKKGDMLAKLSTLSQKTHAKGQPPIDVTYVPMLATEAIDRVYYGDSAGMVIDLVLEDNSSKYASLVKELSKVGEWRKIDKEIRFYYEGMAFGDIYDRRKDGSKSRDRYVVDPDGLYELFEKLPAAKKYLLANVTIPRLQRDGYIKGTKLLKNE